MNENEATQRWAVCLNSTTRARRERKMHVATQTQDKIFHQTQTHTHTHHTCICTYSLNRTIIATWIPFNNFSRWTDYHPCLFSIISIIIYTLGRATSVLSCRIRTMLRVVHKLALHNTYTMHMHCFKSNIRWIKWINVENTILGVCSITLNERKNNNIIMKHRNSIWCKQTLLNFGRWKKRTMS